ncbi:MAG: DNA mismatch repair protein MutS, partial [Polyangiales bacterium]
RQRTGIPNLKVGYTRVFGHYIEVTRARLAAVPEDYQRKQTVAGGERFVTPALQQLQEDLAEVADRLQARERACFDALVSDIVAQAPALLQVAAGVAELDVLSALAEVAAREGHVCPAVDDSTVLDLVGARHPIVAAHLPAGDFVPNDLHLDASKCAFALLTGPNMAGKSTYMRQAALIVILAQMGAFVPAAQARIGVVDRLFTRVGASDNLRAGQSTFMVEMQESARILQAATARSLVLIDEVGRGTSTADGMALAQAIAEHLLDVCHSRTLFATHFHRLCPVADAHPAACNLSLQAVRDGDSVRLLHRVVPGATQQSYGLVVARLAGLPEAVCERAEALLAGSGADRVRDAAAPEAALDASAPAAARDTALPGPRPAAPAPCSPRVPPPRPPEAHPALCRLRALDVQQITPIEALIFLQELQKLDSDTPL